MAESALRGPVPIGKDHQLGAFDCGPPPLNEWLQRYARQNETKRGSRTYVALRDNRVVGYYTICMAEVGHDAAPQRVRKGLGRYPIPVVLLARLAVDRTEQSKGLGRALLKHALLQAISASEVVGCRALLIHAKDEAARDYYRQFGFESSPTNDLHLMLSLHEAAENFR
ncbi:MAG: GNAT family N-acetyltransferase [Armatimonadetes bacterium]|nr:GNAT family N-acetyltransferase [Armatimonadota bacterium]